MKTIFSECKANFTTTHFNFLQQDKLWKMMIKIQKHYLLFRWKVRVFTAWLSRSWNDWKMKIKPKKKRTLLEKKRRWNCSEFLRKVPSKNTVIFPTSHFTKLMLGKFYTQNPASKILLGRINSHIIDYIRKVARALHHIIHHYIF